jgi:hypothetical protein
VKELKDMCKICGMSYSGTKAQCVEKIKIKITEYEESVNIQDSIENLSDSMVANLNNSTCTSVIINESNKVNDLNEDISSENLEDDDDLDYISSEEEEITEEELDITDAISNSH